MISIWKSSRTPTDWVLSCDGNTGLLATKTTQKSYLGYSIHSLSHLINHSISRKYIRGRRNWDKRNMHDDYELVLLKFHLSNISFFFHFSLHCISDYKMRFTPHGLSQLIIIFMICVSITFFQSIWNISLHFRGHLKIIWTQ